MSTRAQRDEHAPARGEIWLADPARSVAGREQAERRPVLIVSADTFNRAAPTPWSLAVVIPLTTRDRGIGVTCARRTTGRGTAPAERGASRAVVRGGPTAAGRTLTGASQVPPPGDPPCYLGPWAIETMGGGGRSTLAGVASTATHGGDVDSSAIGDLIVAMRLIAPSAQRIALAARRPDIVATPNRSETRAPRGVPSAERTVSTSKTTI